MILCSKEPLLSIIVAGGLAGEVEGDIICCKVAGFAIKSVGLWGRVGGFGGFGWKGGFGWMGGRGCLDWLGSSELIF